MSRGLAVVLMVAAVMNLIVSAAGVIMFRAGVPRKAPRFWRWFQPLAVAVFAVGGLSTLALIITVWMME